MPETATAEAPERSQPQLEGGAYEIIRSRLDTHGSELRSRLGKLNDDRQEVFGAIKAQLLSTERVTTKNNCTPRDMISIGKHKFMFGYNVQLGLKSTTDLADVFSIYQHNPEDHSFHECGFDLIGGGDFATDFKYLYKYYRETTFVKFMVIGPHLYAAFRIGRGIDDIKTFKFLIGEGALTYLGNRFDHEYQFPPQQEFEWTRAHRDMHRAGEHPHISIEDRVFVEAVGGDLTVKIEDNTASGKGIYHEPVGHLDQTLDDAETFYATVGSLILLKIRPYQEKDFRILVYNEKTQEVKRIDSIQDSCVLLPDDHGIVFANGYHLQTGETKIFESSLFNMYFDRRVVSSNGEDFLYVFYNRVSGDYVLLPYNIIDQKVETPVVCNGYSLFGNGELIYFRTEDQPQKHHALQIWQTPYTGDNFIPEARTDSYIYKLGNADVVRCMAECHEVLNLLGKDDTYADLYIDLVKKTGDIVDSYFWVGREEAHNLKETLDAINDAAQAAIEEFDKVQRIRRATLAETHRVEEGVNKIVHRVEHSAPDDILGFVHNLAELRRVRGEIISLRERRYADTDLIHAMEAQVEEASKRVSNHCVEFLLEQESLDPYRKQVAAQQAIVPGLKKVTDAEAASAELDNAGAELEMLIDVVSNLKIEDSTQATQIIDDISSIYATLNQVRVELKNRRKALAKVEGVAQFNAQVKLLNQAVINYIDLSLTPEKCEDYLTKLMIQVEELEGRFSDFDEYVEQLTEKREEIYDAFESKKQALLEARNKRAGALVKSAERILNGIRRRVESFETLSDINGYLASDLMIEKVRNVIAELTELGDSVKADSVQTQLKTIREDAVRRLKDRQELFVEGKNIIQLGNHKFSVNTQELELTIVPRDGKMFFHLGGTDYLEEVRNEEFLATAPVWDQEVVSENEAVYRAEFLAAQLLKDLEMPSVAGASLLGVDAVEEFLALAESDQLEAIQRFMGPRYAESYTKGVHDRDCALLLSELLPMALSAGLLRYEGKVRACALLFWEQWAGEEAKQTLETKLNAYGNMRKAFPSEEAQKAYVAELEEGIGAFLRTEPLLGFELSDAREAATYLFHELVTPEAITVSREAADLLTHFQQTLTGKLLRQTFKDACAALEADPVSRYQVICDWIRGFMANAGPTEEMEPRAIEEAAAHLVRGGWKHHEVRDVATYKSIDGMLGSHPSIESGKYILDYNDFLSRLRRFERESAPRFNAYHGLKAALIEERRAEMRLGEFKPVVMSAFVRNKLLDKVYLPLVGDNLAKQMGTVGSETRVDRMGLLLLISPPGYGKTTLMEYIANRLGVTFMKINGPAIGHAITSLDPQDAPNASAREEVMKLNLALEMGDNIMIYVDDIQHCNSEFLQKFISLCDAQRKMEGVYRGVAKTYDLRGKKVAVVMAGNPYTESGGKFQIPDMLANRADTYNLGDILGGHEASFKDSYIENSLTSNPILSKLASRSQKDVYAVMKIAETGSQEGVDFQGNYSIEEINELVSVTRKLMRIRNAILRVNLEYIRSAAMEDQYRTEPAFKLQGSYRNMNRIAEKVLPLMTEEEVQNLIIDHYENESQTLTTSAEANLLKFKELEGISSEEEARRWEQIKKTFNKNQLLGGRGEDDPVTRVVAQLGAFTEGLEKIEGVLATAAEHQVKPATLADVTIAKLEKIIAGLRAVPVDVEIKVLPVQESRGAKPAKKSKPKPSSPPDLPVDIDSKVRQKP